MITGPGSPSVPEHDRSTSSTWTGSRTASRGCVDKGQVSIEPTLDARTRGRARQRSRALTLYPRANSWYMGANAPASRGVLCRTSAASACIARSANEVAAKGSKGSRCADGVPGQRGPARAAAARGGRSPRFRQRAAQHDATPAIRGDYAALRDAGSEAERADRPRRRGPSACSAGRSRPKSSRKAARRPRCRSTCTCPSRAVRRVRSSPTTRRAARKLVVNERKSSAATSGADRRRGRGHGDSARPRAARDGGIASRDGRPARR